MTIVQYVSLSNLPSHGASFPGKVINLTRLLPAMAAAIPPPEDDVDDLGGDDAAAPAPAFLSPDEPDIRRG